MREGPLSSTFNVNDDIINKRNNNFIQRRPEIVDSKIRPVSQVNEGDCTAERRQSARQIDAVHLPGDRDQLSINLESDQQQ